MSVLKGSEHLRLSLNEIQLATNNFNKPIGEGGYGMVYQGQLNISGRPTTVAVKTLGEKSYQGLKQFLTEIQLLTGQNHKNVISLLGSYDPDPILRSRSSKDKNDPRSDRDLNGLGLDSYLGVGSKISLTWKKRLEICLDAARGLNHLHSNIRKKQTIIHRDIKSANILLDDNWVAKIADLGLSKLYSENSEENSIVSDACGTPGYCDPNYYDGILRKEYDVYSFGIVLFEVLCGRLCHVQYKKGGFVLSGASVQMYYKQNNMKEIIDPCLRLQMSLYSIKKFSEVAYSCLLNDEGQRPSMNRIVKELEELLFMMSSSLDVRNATSYSHSHDPISKLRYEKVRRLFHRFDVNRDGVLNKEELANFFIVTNPQVKFSEDEISDKIDSLFHWYGESTNGKQGLTCDGMLRSYSHGVDNLSSHFEMLRLTFSNEGPLETAERYEKVKRVFQQFDLNRDGWLDKLELACLLATFNPDQDEEEFLDNVNNFLCLYGEFNKDQEGINCEGLCKFYDFGIDNLDEDLEKLNLKLKPFEEYELSLRYEKVRRIFQRFDINEDGGLNKEELIELYYTTSGAKADKEVVSSIVDHVFSMLREFTDGEKGLTCDSLLQSYEWAGDDFKMLRLDLKPLDDREDALRKKERAEKVRIIFDRFDVNGDGGLDKWELGVLLIKRNPHNEAPEKVWSYVDKVFHWYAKYIDGDKGLTYDGLLRTYDHGIDSLDVDFETLGLEFRTLTETENASRKRDRCEKVRQIFKRFDINGDGGLDRKEMDSYLVAVHPEDQLSEERMTSTINYMFQILGEFVDGVTGLSCDGLIKNYDCGEDNLDAHFTILKLR